MTEKEFKKAISGSELWSKVNMKPIWSGKDGQRIITIRQPKNTAVYSVSDKFGVIEQETPLEKLVLTANGRALNCSQFVIWL